MTAKIINGKVLAQQIQHKLSTEVKQIVQSLGRPPGLAVVLVGDNSASKVYVKAKSNNAAKCGIKIFDLFLPQDTNQSILEAELKSLSLNLEVDGILLQLPLPKHLDEFSALCCIAPDKDVDGLHPLNQGLLLRGAPGHRPCTPLGVMELINQACLELGRPTELNGLHAVVVGRSILVGKPVSFLLLEKNCTVSIAHSRTRDLHAQCRQADILVAAVGVPRLINKDYVKPGAIVIDVGINQGSDGKLCGDVDFDSAAENASALTPVPGGVGPMTIAMLLSNTVSAAKSKCQEKSAFTKN